jgi:hypothetical protein
MTVRDLINLLETYMPDLDASLRVKIVGSDSSYKFYVVGGENSVTLLVDPKNRKENQQ